jgi:hypothetical protein
MRDNVMGLRFNALVRLFHATSSSLRIFALLQRLKIKTYQLLQAKVDL